MALVEVLCVQIVDYAQTCNSVITGIARDTVATAEQILTRNLQIDGSASFGRYGKLAEAIM